MANSSAREVDKKSLIEQYVNITGSDEESAEHLLDAFSWNLESAVNMYLEGGTIVENNKNDDDISEILTASTSSGNSSNTKNINRASKKHENNDQSDDDPILVDVDSPQCSSLYERKANTAVESVDVDDYVRAPIPQQQAVLVEDQYHALPYPQRQRQLASRNVFDGFRDFQKEAEEQEKLLRSGANSTTARKKKRLHELFRPPVDILHHGDFQSARTKCTLKNRWLLVNVQNTMEFASQVLNRDVWSNKIVREILNENFILWQVYHDSNEGQHYETFYKIRSYPHLAVIDPRTGERMVVWENLGARPSANQFAELATLFLSENPSLVGELNNSGDEVDMKITTDVDASEIIDRSEEAQLEAAIQASLEIKTIPKVISVHDDDSSDSCNDESDGLDDDDIKEIDCVEDVIISKRRKLNHSSENSVIVKEEKPKNQEKPESMLKTQIPSTIGGNSAESKEVTDERPSLRKDGEQAKILLRTPTNERKQIVVSLECTLEELGKEVSHLGWSSTRYELVRSFPRQNLSTLNQQQTLKETGLHKQETLFIQDR